MKVGVVRKNCVVYIITLNTFFTYCAIPMIQLTFNVLNVEFYLGAS